MPELLYLIPLAFVAGVVDAIAGGGGVFTVPALLYSGLPPALVLGTNKVVSTCGTTAATWTFWKSGNANPAFLKFTIPCAAVGALIGASVASSIPASVMRPMIAWGIIALAIYFFLRPKLGLTGTYHDAQQNNRAATCGAVFTIGFYDGIFGPGTGTFLTTLLVRFLHMDFLRAAGNTKALNLTSNVIALGVFLWMGNVVFSFGIPMALANIAGGFIGARLAISLGSGWIRWAFLVMALAVAARMLTT